MQVFRKLQFVSHCYTAVSCQPIYRHSVYNNSAVYLSVARVRLFLEIRGLGSPTKRTIGIINTLDKPQKFTEGL